MLKILGKRTSINVRKVLWTCAAGGLDYTLEEWGSGVRPLDVPAFLALNPNAQVPVLVHDGFVLWESNTICRYLAGLAGGGTLLPVAAQARALVEQWMDWQATELNPAWRHAFLALVRHSPAHDDAAQIAASVAQWNAKMSLLEHQLARTGAYVTGPAFTLADVVLGLSINRWRRTPIAHAELPEVAAYFERLRAVPGFAEHCDNGVA
jgi:glutathione S-transferase